MVYQTEFYRRYLSEGITGKKSFAESLEEYGPKGFRSRTEFFLNGRAPFALQDTGMFPRYSAKELVHVACTPSFLRSWHNHIDNYGNFIPGYCGGLSLGAITDLPSLVEEGLLLADRPVLWFIIRDDFQGLLRFAESEGYRVNPKGYLSKCHLCADIRMHLTRADSFPELEPERFYTELQSIPPSVELIPLPQVPQNRAFEGGPQGCADSRPFESPVRPVVAGKEEVVVVPGEVEELIPTPLPEYLLLYG